MRRIFRRLVSPTVTVFIGCGAALFIVWWSVTNGRAEQRSQPGLLLGAAPLVGRSSVDGWHWRFGWSTALAALLASAVVIAHHREWWTRVRLRYVAAATGAGAALFAVLLALTDGVSGLTYGAKHPTEYLANLSSAPPAGEFVRTFVDRINDYSVHVRGHPPGFILMLKAMDAIGLGGIWPLVVLTGISCGVVAVAVMWTIHLWVGQEWARRVAPFLIVSPAAIWMATSADAVFSMIGAVGVLVATYGACRRPPRAVLFGLVSGVLLGWLVFLTYLGAIFLVIPIVIVIVAFVHHKPGAVAVGLGGLIGGLFVLYTFWVFGFWLLDGVAITKREYFEGSAQFRDWNYFKVGNIGAALFAIGPATVIGLASLRNRRLWWIVAAAGIALLLSHVSQYTKAEVERIWLPYYPWLIVASAGAWVFGRRWIVTTVIALQALSAIVLQAALVTKW